MSASWELGAGSWELGAGSWELGAGKEGCRRCGLSASLRPPVVRRRRRWSLVVGRQTSFCHRLRHCCCCYDLSCVVMGGSSLSLSFVVCCCGCCGCGCLVGNLLSALIRLSLVFRRSRTDFRRSSVFILWFSRAASLCWCLRCSVVALLLLLL